MPFADYLRQHLAWMRSSTSEYAMALAIAGLILVLADAVLIYVLGWVAPPWSVALEHVDRDLRIALFGLPAALLLLGAVLFLQWRSLRRSDADVDRRSK